MDTLTDKLLTDDCCSPSIRLRGFVRLAVRVNTGWPRSKLPGAEFFACLAVCVMRSNCLRAGGCERTHVCCSAMLTVASKLKREEGVRAGGSPAGSHDASHRVSIRDRLLIKGMRRLKLIESIKYYKHCQY